MVFEFELTPNLLSHLMAQEPIVHVVDLSVNKFNAVHTYEEIAGTNGGRDMMAITIYNRAALSAEYLTEKLEKGNTYYTKREFQDGKPGSPTHFMAAEELFAHSEREEDRVQLALLHTEENRVHRECVATIDPFLARDYEGKCLVPFFSAYLRSGAEFPRQEDSKGSPVWYGFFDFPTPRVTVERGRQALVDADWIYDSWWEDNGTNNPPEDYTDDPELYRYQKIPHHLPWIMKNTVMMDSVTRTLLNTEYVRDGRCIVSTHPDFPWIVESFTVVVDMVDLPEYIGHVTALEPHFMHAWCEHSNALQRAGAESRGDDVDLVTRYQVKDYTEPAEIDLE